MPLLTEQAALPTHGAALVYIGLGAVGALVAPSLAFSVPDSQRCRMCVSIMLWDAIADGVQQS